MNVEQHLAAVKWLGLWVNMHAAIVYAHRRHFYVLND